jgi:hypothetical protein
MTNEHEDITTGLLSTPEGGFVEFSNNLVNLGLHFPPSQLVELWETERVHRKEERVHREKALANRKEERVLWEKKMKRSDVMELKSGRMSQAHFDLIWGKKKAGFFSLFLYCC